MSEDHDMLIRVDAHLDSLCKQICKIEKTTDDIYEKVDEQKEHCSEIQRKNFEMLDKRPKLNLILWLFGGVFIILLMIGGVVIDNRNSINTYHPQTPPTTISNNGESN